VSDATAASKERNNPIFCAVSDAAVASDTENHGSCKQTLKSRETVFLKCFFGTECLIRSQKQLPLAPHFPLPEAFDNSLGRAT
jgi:hypothetical protein